MESNDFWTHVGLVLLSFLIVVGPRLLSPGHEVNSLIYLVGGTVVIAAATVARFRAVRNSPHEPDGF
jgi:hypothetical protein